MMNRKEMMAARAALVDAHRYSGNITPAGTVATLVNTLGYESAREAVALAVLAKGEWDCRISERSRAWAFDLTGTTCGDLFARGFYYPDEIHPAHMEQIAGAMMAYQPEPAPAAVEYVETRTMDAETLRSVCIVNSWYTRGTNAQYNGLFDRLRDERGNLADLTTAKLAEIAADIYHHSDLPNDYGIPEIMFELARRCTVCFRAK